MFYLFILESIGTSELLMIGLIALIIFGPRRLPQMMRTIGKTVAEFRRSTDDFKRTWQKEVEFEINEFQTPENSDLLLGSQPRTENSIANASRSETNKIVAPEIREVSSDNFSANIPKIETSIVGRNIPRQNDACDSAYLPAIANLMTQKYPFVKMQNRLKLGKFDEWQQEGFQIASTKLYPSSLKFGEMPSDGYKKQAFEIAEEQIALAGYRMGEMLNQIFAEK